MVTYRKEHSGMTHKGNLIISLVIALTLSSLTWVVTSSQFDPSTGPWLDYIGPVLMIPLFPGFLLSIIVSGNIHTFRTSTAIVGNFIFYFGVIYLTLRNRIRRRLSRIQH
jgi:hypothetical protein